MRRVWLKSSTRIQFIQQTSLPRRDRRMKNFNLQGNSMGLPRIFLLPMLGEAQLLLGPRGPRAGEAPDTSSTCPSSTTLEIRTSVIVDVSFLRAPLLYHHSLVSFAVRRLGWSSRRINHSIPEPQILSPHGSAEYIRHSRLNCQRWPRIPKALSDLARRRSSSAWIVDLNTEQDTAYFLAWNWKSLKRIWIFSPQFSGPRTMRTVNWNC